MKGSVVTRMEKQRGHTLGKQRGRTLLIVSPAGHDELVLDSFLYSLKGLPISP